MAFIDVTADTSVAASGRTLRRMAKHSIQTLQADLEKIVVEVNAHGKNALATELGSDAAEFADFYDNGRLLVLAHKPSVTTIPLRADLPA